MHNAASRFPLNSLINVVDCYLNRNSSLTQTFKGLVPEKNSWLLFHDCEHILIIAIVDYYIWTNAGFDEISSNIRGAKNNSSSLLSQN